MDQMIRSSRSVNSHIAEGHGRRTDPERIRFCIVARGSLSELLNHMIDAYDSEYLDEETLKKFRLKIKVVESILNGYIATLKIKLYRTLINIINLINYSFPPTASSHVHAKQ